MLHIHNLHATIAGKAILDGLSLSLNAGGMHTVIEPSGPSNLTPSRRVSR